MTRDDGDRTIPMHADRPREERRPVVVDARGRSDVGLVRTNNEDAFLLGPLGGASVAPPGGAVPLGPRGFLLAVSDGMGGSEAGEVASRICVETLARVLGEEWAVREERTELVELRNDLRTAVLRAHRAVVDDAQTHPGRTGMGATLTAAVVHADHVLVAHVGDSRCYLYRSGVLKCLTSDQSLAEELVRRGIVERGSAAYDARRNMLTRVVGQMGRLEPDAEAAALARGDVLLLCSDGLYGPVKDDEIAALLAGGGDPEALAAALVEAARRNGAPDNVTCVVARVSGEGLPDPQTAEAGGATVSVHMDPAALAAAERTAAMAAPALDPTGEFSASQFEADDTLAAAIAPGARPVPARAFGRPASTAPGAPQRAAHGGHGHAPSSAVPAPRPAPWAPDPAWGPGARDWMALVTVVGALLVAWAMVT